MYNQKVRTGAPRVTAPKPMRAARRRQQLHPFFFRMGSVALCITSVLLVGLMAVLYLSQVGQAVAVNQSLQDIRSEQSTLAQQDQDLVDTIAHEQSPAVIEDAAKKMGLTPTDPKHVWILAVPNWQQVMDEAQSIQP